MVTQCVDYSCKVPITLLYHLYKYSISYIFNIQQMNLSGLRAYSGINMRFQKILYCNECRWCCTVGADLHPFINAVCSLLWVAVVYALTLAHEVLPVGCQEVILHAEALVREQRIGNRHNISVRFGRQGLMQLPQHFIRTWEQNQFLDVIYRLEIPILWAF